jgi:hypothetical protein
MLSLTRGEINRALDALAADGLLTLTPGNYGVELTLGDPNQEVSP